MLSAASTAAASALIALTALVSPVQDTGRAPEALARLEQMRKAADDLDEAANPAAYRDAWVGVLAYAATLYPQGHAALAAIESELALADYLQGDVRGALARLQRLTPVLDRAGAPFAAEVDANMNMEVVALLSLGRFDEARAVGRKLLDRRIARFGDKAAVAVAAAYANYAHTEFEVGNYAAATALSRRALAEARRLTPVPVNAAVYFSNLPLYLGASGRTEEAIEAARETEQLFTTILPADHPYHISNLDNLARFQLQFGRAREAEATAQRAVELARRKYGERHQTGSLMTILAQTMVAQGNAAGGAAVANEAAKILAAGLGEEADRTLLAREAVASAMADAGDRGSALALLDQIAAVRARKLPPFHRDRIGGADRRATLALRLGELAIAKRAQTDAQELRRASMPAGNVMSLVGEARLAAIDARSGETVAGLRRALAAAASLDEQLLRVTAAGSRRSGRDREIQAGYAWALDAALSAGDAAAAFRLSQRLTDGAAGRAAQQAAARVATGDPALAALMREQQDAAVELEALLDRQLRLAGRGADAAVLRASEAAGVAAAAKLAARTAALRARAPEIAAAQEVEPITLAAAQAALAPGEALLVTAVGEERTGVIAVTREAIAMSHTDQGSDRLGKLVRRLRSSLSPEAVQRGAAFDFAASAELHAALLPPPIRATIRGKSRLLIAANGPLSALPFATLAPAAREPSLRNARWLIRDHAIVTLPAVSSVALTPSTSGDRAIASFTAVGAPDLGGTSAGPVAAFRSANMARQVRELPALPATEPELRSLGAALGATRQRILVGASATEQAVGDGSLGDADVLAFATHGLTAGELDGLDEPALVLTPAAGDDGLLTASEIMRLRLRAAWVILSACNTAAGGGSDSSGLAGLARAFLHAGGRNLLASHWAVRDDAAAQLTVDTVRRYRAGAEPAQSLRQAMLRMIDQRPVAGGEHPIHWAPFVFVGR